MTFTRWFRSVFASRSTARKSPPSRRLAVEPLEDRLTPSSGGILDSTFGSGGVVTSSFSGRDLAQDVQVQPDGKIVIAGQASTSTPTGGEFLVARYNANGTLDTTFGSGGRTLTDFNKSSDMAFALALQPGTNGKLLAGGYATSVKGNTSTLDFALVRYNANGTLDTTFGSRGKVVTDLGTTSDAAYAMAVQSDGRIILAGYSGGNLALVRYTASGALDSTFGSGGKLLTTIAVGSGHSHTHDVAVSLQTDGRIVVAANTPNTSARDFLLARFNANGTTDTSFGGGTGWVTTDFGGRNAWASGLAIQSDGRIVVAGTTGVPDVGNEVVALARYNPDGSLDASFGTGGLKIAPLPQPSDPMLETQGQAADVAIQTDGRIIVAGAEFTYTVSGQYVPGSTRAIAERFNADGTVDTSYGPAGTGVSEVPIDDASEARTLVIQSDGKVVVAGQANFGATGYEVALFRLLPAAPQIGSFTANPDPVTSGSNVTLTVSGITDGNPSSSITQVAFYLDSNGDGLLEPGTDTLLGYGTQSNGTWTRTFSTTDWAAAVDTLFALAKDNYGVFGDPFALTLQVV